MGSIVSDHLGGPQKRIIALRYWLQGRGYHLALDALHFASQYHCGLRKDGVTPELDHQVSIALFARTLQVPDTELEKLIVVILLHDVREDYSTPDKVPQGLPVVTEEIIIRLFGADVAFDVELLSKVADGEKKDSDTYFFELRQSWRACLVKLLDRLHNLSTMQGAFSRTKQVEYVAEARKDILPIARFARRAFSRFEAAFENVKLGIKLQIALLDKLNQAEAA
jgi:(p)ppGpp synthase/HD superfamily hydrolase